MPRFRLAALAATLALGAAAGPSQAAVISPETPDCSTTCTKTLGPGQRLVVGDRFFTTNVTVSGTADVFGAHFVIKNSRDGSTYKAIGDLYGNAFSQNFYNWLNPTLVPGYFRAVAINEGTIGQVKVTLSLSGR